MPVVQQRTGTKAKETMVAFFKRKKKHQPAILYFKSNEAAFGFACRNTDCTLELGNIVPALVEKERWDDKEHRQAVVLKIASADGGRRTRFYYVTDYVPPLHEGDLVGFEVLTVVPGVQSTLGTFGVVVAKLKPELDVQRGWKTDP